MCLNKSRVGQMSETSVLTKSFDKLSDEVYEVELEDQPFFPDTSPASSRSYRFSNISLYSSGNIEQSKYTSMLLASYFDLEDLKSVTITDATSCIGGNTWSFAKVFGRVHAVELDPLHMTMLKHNMNLLGLTSAIDFYPTNYLSVASSLRQDIIYLDPPWGGRDYKSNPRIGLYNDKGEFVDIPSLLHNPEFGKDCQVIALKVPKNFSTFRLAKEGFEYKRVYSLKTQEKETLYKIVIFSRSHERRKVHRVWFKRSGYKSLRWRRRE
jgi:predicted RNA methylase